MNQIKNELDKIPVPEEVLEAMYKGIQQAKREEQVTEMKPRVKSKRKKIMVSLASLAAVGGIFIGSAFVSPAMAEMAAKIPYLREIFIKDEQLDVQPVFHVLREKALKLGYTVENMGIGSYDDPDTLVIHLKNEDYNSTSKQEVEKLVKDILDKKGYYAQSIEVLPFDEDLYQSMMRINILMNQEAKEMKKEVEAKGYQIDFVGMNREMNEVFVILPDTEKRVDEVRNILQAYQKATYNEFPLDIRTVNLQEMDPATKLKRNLYTSFEGLVSKKEYKVEYFKYTQEGQLLITIKASLDKDKKDHVAIADKIQNDVKSVLDKEYKQPYTIEIYGINNERIK